MYIFDKQTKQARLSLVKRKDKGKFDLRLILFVAKVEETPLPFLITSVAFN